MNPITHFLVGWTALERLLPSRRDKALVCFSGLAPDLDGLGIVVDAFTRVAGLSETDLYQQFHRVYGHGLPAAWVIAIAVALCARLRTRTALWSLVAVHLHFVCDLLGSRGSTPEDIWPIYYLAPISMHPQWSLSFQWPLVGWQNLVISALLMLIAVERATRTGYAPVVVFSARADAVFVGVLRGWRASLRRLFRRSP